MSYKLVWQDLFDQDGHPNKIFWVHETGGHGFGNHEAQFYTDRLDNSYVKDGHLYIVAKKEDYQKNKYTSAKLTTYQKNHMSSGRIEVMAQLPLGHGTWPAIWLLGENFKSNVDWPLCGEIDLLEHVGHHPNYVHFSLHSKNAYFHLNNQLNKIVFKEGLIKGFHEYSMDWTADSITFYLDKVEQVTFTKKPNATIEDWPFNQPFYLILNLALGGSWGGPIDDAMLPSTFVFKYVKVYEKVV
ncbi:MAG: family 16 glycosylhydrolase [Acholeplasmataceae bacterium]